MFGTLFHFLMITNYVMINRPCLFLLLIMLQIDLALFLWIVSFYYALLAIFTMFIYSGVGVRGVEYVLLLLLLSF